MWPPTVGGTTSKHSRKQRKNDQKWSSHRRLAIRNRQGFRWFRPSFSRFGGAAFPAEKSRRENGLRRFVPSYRRSKRLSRTPWGVDHVFSMFSALLIGNTQIAEKSPFIKIKKIFSFLIEKVDFSAICVSPSCATS